MNIYQNIWLCIWDLCSVSIVSIPQDLKSQKFVLGWREFNDLSS